MSDDTASPARTRDVARQSAGAESRLRKRIQAAPYNLNQQFADVTILTAATFTQSDVRLNHLTDAAVSYAVHQAQIYTDFWLTDRTRMAHDFAGESRKALLACLRHFGEPRPKWAVGSIYRVGHQMGRIPLDYGQNLLADVLALDKHRTLSWLHLDQLSRVAAYGPAIVLEPLLVPWLDRNEPPNQRRLVKYNTTIAENREYWQQISTDILDLAGRAVNSRLRPLQLERKVNQLLGLPVRGRPPKRVIDPNAEIRIPPIPV